MAVSSSNGGLGSFAGDLVMTMACGTIGAVVGKGSPGGSWKDGDRGESAAVVSRTLSFITCAASISGVSGGLVAAVSEFVPPGTGSGRHSRFDFSQRGQTQLRDLDKMEGEILDRDSKV
jgi:hypothetical protein